MLKLLNSCNNFCQKLYDIILSIKILYANVLHSVVFLPDRVKSQPSEEVYLESSLSELHTSSLLKFGRLLNDVWIPSEKQKNNRFNNYSQIINNYNNNNNNNPVCFVKSTFSQYFICDLIQNAVSVGLFDNHLRIIFDLKLFLLTFAIGS